MSRTHLILLVAAAMLPACDSNSDPDQPGGALDGGLDASQALDGGADASAAIDAAADADAAAACPPLSATPAMHGGDVKGTEVWTAVASPHVITSDVHVRDGAQLIIEPCAVVQLAAGVGLNVAFPLTPNTGTLIAEGTPSRPIRFEGLAGARWGNVVVHAPGTASFAHTTLRDGGGTGTDSGESIWAMGDSALPSDPILKVVSVTVEGSLGAGIKLSRGAKFAAGSSDLTIRNSGDEARPFPLSIGELAIDSVPSGSYTGNRVSEILIEPETVSGASGVQESVTMHDRGVPYRIGTSPGLDDLRVGSRTPNPPALLTIEPGVTIKFLKGSGLSVDSPDGSDVTARGAVRAVGTAQRPIVFTSAEQTKAAGDWRGFFFHGIAHPDNRLEHVRIEYTGADCSCGLVTCTLGVAEFEAALIFLRRPPTAFLANSVIAHGAGHGVAQGWDNPPHDWTSSNTFQNVAGCVQTAPRNSDTSCPDPRPTCEPGT